MSERWELPANPKLRLHSSSGDITIIAEDREDLEAEVKGGRSPALQREDDGRTISIRARRLGSKNILIRCPTGTDISIGSVSGDIRLDGSFGRVKATTISGDVKLDFGTEVDLRSVSGHLIVNSCRDGCSLHTKSGRISVDGVDGPARASTISGTVDIGTSGRDSVSIKSISGGVSVKVPHDKRPKARLRSLSGRVRCECPQGSDFDIQASTISGRIEVEGQ
jgi:DUF4097 and DUF4098 domain-containing protein YvlB